MHGMGTQIVFLGTGTPNPDPDRYGPAVAMIAGDRPYLVDCGVGVVRRATLAQRQGVEALAVERLDRVLLTHLHSDHTLGLPDLMLTPAVTGRTSAIEIWGPAGTDRMVTALRDAWSEDRDVRLHGGEPSLPDAYETTVHEIGEGSVLTEGELRVTAFRVIHGAWRHAFGFRFETPDRVIVHSGDTTYCENLIARAAGADVLIHEAYSAKGLAARAPEWRAYHSTYHTSAVDVGRVAAVVQPKLLILNHVLPFGQPVEQLLAEVAEHFSGPTVVANDLDVF